MNKIFVTATGTDIGKTLVTTSLCYQLAQAGYRVRALKPVISGYSNDENSDTALILHSLGLPVTPETIESTSPWRFTAPLSPDMAAAKEGRLVLLEEIVDFCLAVAADSCDFLIIEGAGGLMTPLTAQATMLELIERTKAGVMLVTGSYLGSLSHSLTALEVIRARNLPLHAVIISESAHSTVSLAETQNSLQHFTKAPVILLPRLPCANQLWKLAPSFARVLFS
jgi:dethiobiotin synthetase